MIQGMKESEEAHAFGVHLTQILKTGTNRFRNNKNKRCDGKICNTNRIKTII